MIFVGVADCSIASTFSLSGLIPLDEIEYPRNSTWFWWNVHFSELSVTSFADITVKNFLND